MPADLISLKKKISFAESPVAHVNDEILKRLLSAKFPIEIDYTADFWGFWENCVKQNFLQRILQSLLAAKSSPSKMSQIWFLKADFWGFFAAQILGTDPEEEKMAIKFADGGPFVGMDPGIDGMCDMGMSRVTYQWAHMNDSRHTFVGMDPGRWYVWHGNESSVESSVDGMGWLRLVGFLKL